MLCSVFSVSAPILLSFDSQAFSEGKKKKKSGQNPSGVITHKRVVPLLARDTGQGEVRGFYWAAVASRDTAASGCGSM